MSAWGELADGATAIGLAFVGVSTYLQVRESRRGRAQRDFAMYQSFEDRLEVLAPDLGVAFGAPRDEIPEAHRALAVRTFVLVAQYFEATRSGVYEGAADDGLEDEFGYWVSRPEMVEAWAALRSQAGAWPQGFDEFVLRLQRGACL